MKGAVKEVVGGNTVSVYGVSDDNVLERRSAKSHSQRISTILKEMFLPQGYPDSVSADYLSYQIWDTLQELCSSLNGTLASHAVFKGMGVGDTEATALSATYTWLLKDGTGMVSNILFAWSRGTLLDIDAKRWRLFADVLNDIAMFVDLLSPLAPSCFTLTVCFTSVCRSLVGVAGGCTRATIKQHQATSNNTADVSAKDGSQEKLSNLLALLLSMTLIHVLTSSQALTWFSFTLLTSLHLYFNYRACSCLVMRTLNPNRYTLLLRHWFQEKTVLSPGYVNSVEPFIWGVPKRKYSINMGASIDTLCSKRDLTADLHAALSTVPFVIYRSYTGSVEVCFSVKCTHRDVLAAYYIATSYTLGTCHPDFFIPSPETLTEVECFLRSVEGGGWDVSFAPLGTADLRYSSDQ